MLKKEVAELRANQALHDTAELTGQLTGGSSMLQQQISKARGVDLQARAEVDMERSAHRETIEALEASEATVSNYNSKAYEFPLASTHKQP